MAQLGEDPTNKRHVRLLVWEWFTKYFSCERLVWEKLGVHRTAESLSVSCSRSCHHRVFKYKDNTLVKVYFDGSHLIRIQSVHQQVQTTQKHLRWQFVQLWAPQTTVCLTLNNLWLKHNLQTVYEADFMTVAGLSAKIAAICQIMTWMSDDLFCRLEKISHADESCHAVYEIYFFKCMKSNTICSCCFEIRYFVAD